MPSGRISNTKGGPLGNASSSLAFTITASTVVHIVSMLLVKMGQWSLKSSTWMAMVPVAVLSGVSGKLKKKKEIKSKNLTFFL